MVQKIKFFSLKKFCLLGSMVESWISPWLVLFSYYSFLTFDHMNIISFHSLPPPLYLDHWNWASSFLGYFSVAIKSFSVIFFFLLAFVNNQRYEIDFLTPGDAPRLPDYSYRSYYGKVVANLILSNVQILKILIF